MLPCPSITEPWVVHMRTLFWAGSHLQAHKLCQLVCICLHWADQERSGLCNQGQKILKGTWNKNVSVKEKKNQGHVTSRVSSLGRGYICPSWRRWLRKKKKKRSLLGPLDSSRSWSDTDLVQLWLPFLLCVRDSVSDSVKWGSYDQKDNVCVGMCECMWTHIAHTQI